MKKILRNTINYSLSFILSILFLYFAFKDTDFLQLWEILKTTNYFWVFMILPCLFISHFIRAWRWQVFLKPIKKTSLRNCWSALLIGYMANNVLPRAGEFVRPLSIGKLEGISRSASFGTVLYERIIDILIMLFLLIALLFFYHEAINSAFPEFAILGLHFSIMNFVIILSIAEAAGTGLVGLLVFNRLLGEKIFTALFRFLPEKISVRGNRVLHSLLDGFLTMKDKENYLINVVLSIVTWLLYAFMMYFPLLAFPGMPVNAQTFTAALVILAISNIGLVLPTPGGIGTYHYFVMITLQKIYNVPLEVALGYAVVTHAAGYISVTIAGLIYFLKDHISFKEALKTEVENS